MHQENRTVFQSDRVSIVFGAVLTFCAIGVLYWGGCRNIIFSHALYSPVAGIIILLLAIALTIFLPRKIAGEFWQLEFLDDVIRISRPWLKHRIWRLSKTESILKPGDIRTIEIRETGYKRKAFSWKFLSSDGTCLDHITTSGNEDELHEAIKAWAAKHDTQVVFKRKN